MSTQIQEEKNLDQLSEVGKEIARRSSDIAKDTADKATVAAKDLSEVAGGVAHATMEAADRATESAKDAYKWAAEKAEDTLTTSKVYVRHNPVSAVLGAIAVGVLFGYLLTMPRR